MYVREYLIHNQYFKPPHGAPPVYMQPFKLRSCLTCWKTLSIALRAAGHINVFMVCAVVTEPLPPAAQQQARLFPCAAHIIQKNGA